MLTKSTFPVSAPVSVVNMSTGTECIPVFSLCAKAYGVTKAEILSQTRRQDVAIARHASRFFYHLIIKNAAHMAKAGFSKSHAGILHSNKVIENIATTKNQYRQRFEELEMDILASARRYAHRKYMATLNRKRIYGNQNTNN